MHIRRSWFLCSPVLIVLTLLTGFPPRNVPGAPAPKAKTYALVYIPKQETRSETSRFRRSQIALFRSGNARFLLYWAIRNLKKADLPSLPKKGKGEGEGDAHEEDVAWLTQNLKVEYLDGTGVLRIALSVGSHREQALLVNAVAQAYFQLEADPRKKRTEESLSTLKEMLKALQNDTGTLEEDKKAIERDILAVKAEIKNAEAYLRASPQLLELAEVPPD